MRSTSDLSWSLAPDLAARVNARRLQLREQDVVRRIWNADASVWQSADEARWLGWLTLPTGQQENVNRILRFANQIRHEKITDVVLIGMGGSSMAPEVMQSIIMGHAGHQAGFPNLHVLDSTDPAQILAMERAIDLQHTLFLVASKSGSTLEVNILKQYFFHRAVLAFGEGEAGRHFVLTTDPGSKLQAIAKQEHFREIFPGVPSVGGRYSALSSFGLVPAAAIGVDIVKLLECAARMTDRCASDGDDNPGFELGVLLGTLALEGHDKPTLIAPASIAGFGAWLEQLVAESLGKQGKGVIPIDGETIGSADVYGDDRVFVHLRLASAPDPSADAAVERLQHAGHPVIRIEWADRYSLGAEFYRWEFATAVMGAVLGVNPFDQPDVEESKIVTRRLAAEYEKTGKLPDDSPLTAGEATALVPELSAFFEQLHAGDYFAVLAFIQMNAPHRLALQALGALVRDGRKVATSVGFGPRYLHSTGQAHKGGPNSGVFLLITCDESEDLLVPGQRYTFGTIKLLQACGDYEVLKARDRRLLRVHLTDVESGLRTLHVAVQQALS